MDKKKKGLILIVLGIISLVLVTVGVTYAFFSYTKEGTTDNTLTSGTITFLYTEVSGAGRGISIDDALPTSDDLGKRLTGEGKVFDFKITSNTSETIAIPYEITARMKEGSDLDPKAVRIYLTKVNGTTEEEVLLDNYDNLTQTSRVDENLYIEKTIYTGKVPSNQKPYSQDFRLRMWVDGSIDYSPVKDENGNDTYPYNDKKFTITVNVYAEGKVVTGEDIELESNNEIASISAEGKKAVASYSDSYDYELGLDTGTTTTNLIIDTENEDTEVKVEKVDSLASSDHIERLSATKSISLTEGDNYFKITTTSLTGEKKISTLNIHVGEYKESLLNETDPVLSNSLVPVMITDNGEVQKVDTTYNWYDYETKYWANAVVLRNSDTYKVGEVIPEKEIQSYFVWIPKYSYQLWDLGNYSSLTSENTSKPHAIPIRFGLTNTSDSVTGECTTPGTAGGSGSCSVGDYMTHPAFLAFDTNGIWVGKFETGYDGATTPDEAKQKEADSSKIIIKPNAHSWVGISISNAFQSSYTYLSSATSHMMKNTEWGAVAYLSHSLYGTCEEKNGKVTCSEVRINNNSNRITGYSAVEAPTTGYTSGNSTAENRIEKTSLGVDGTYTINYFNPASILSSTTGNYTGIYDMNGGFEENMMGYTTGASSEGDSSGITTLYPKFFTDSSWNKYYDKYSATVNTNYNNRILGDATGELGPFFKSTSDSDGVARQKSSWYNDYGNFIYSAYAWFRRGGYYETGNLSGIFASHFSVGNGHAFRVVLAPTK